MKKAKTKTMTTEIVSNYLEIVQKPSNNLEDSDKDYTYAQNLFEKFDKIDYVLLRTRCSNNTSPSKNKLAAKKQSLIFGNFHAIDNLKALPSLKDPSALQGALLKTQDEAEAEEFEVGKTDPRYRLVPVNVFALIANHEISANIKDDITSTDSKPVVHSGHTDAGGVNFGAYSLDTAARPRARRRFVRIGIDARNARMEIQLRPPLQHVVRFENPKEKLWTPDSRQFVPMTFGQDTKTMFFDMPPSLAAVLGNTELRAAAWDMASVNQHVNDCLVMWVAAVYLDMRSTTRKIKDIKSPVLDLQLDTSYWRLRLTFTARYTFALSGCGAAGTVPYAPLTDLRVSAAFVSRPLPNFGLDDYVRVTNNGNLVHRDASAAQQGYSAIYTISGTWSTGDKTNILDSLAKKSESLQDVLGTNPVLRAVADSPDVRVLLPPPCAPTKRYINDLSMIPGRGADTMALPAAAVPAHYHVHDIDPDRTATLRTPPAVAAADAFLQSGFGSSACVLTCGDRPPLVDYSNSSQIHTQDGKDVEWGKRFPGSDGLLYPTAYAISDKGTNSRKQQALNAANVYNDDNYLNQIENLPRFMVQPNDIEPGMVFAVLLSRNLRFQMFLKIGEMNPSTGLKCMPLLPTCLAKSTRPESKVCGVCVRDDRLVLSWYLAQNYFYHPNAVPVFEGTSTYKHFADRDFNDLSNIGRANRFVVAHQDTYCKHFGTYISDAPDELNRTNRPPMACMSYSEKYNAIKINVTGRYIDPACNLYNHQITKETMCDQSVDAAKLPESVKGALSRPRALSQLISDVKDDVLYGQGPNYDENNAELYISDKQAGTNFKDYFNELGSIKSQACNNALYVNNNNKFQSISKDNGNKFCDEIKPANSRNVPVTLPQALSSDMREVNKMTIQICSSVTDLENAMVGGSVKPACQNIVDNRAPVIAGNTNKEGGGDTNNNGGIGSGGGGIGSGGGGGIGSGGGGGGIGSGGGGGGIGSGGGGGGIGSGGGGGGIGSGGGGGGIGSGGGGGIGSSSDGGIGSSGGSNQTAGGVIQTSSKNAGDGGATTSGSFPIVPSIISGAAVIIVIIIGVVVFLIKRRGSNNGTK